MERKSVIKESPKDDTLSAVTPDIIPRYNSMTSPPQRPRILIVSSSAPRRERFLAVLGERYEVRFPPELPPGRDFTDVPLAVVDERDRFAATGASIPCPLLLVREAFEPAELLERVEMRLEISRLRAEAAAQEGPAQDAQERLGFLVSAAEGMANAPDLEAALSSLCASAVPRLAQWCSVSLREGGRLVARKVWHQSSDRAHLLSELGDLTSPQDDRRNPVHRVIASGRSEFVAAVPDSFASRIASSERHRSLMRDLGTASLMCVPIRSRGKAVGALLLGADAGWRPLARADLLLAEQLGAKAGSAIERARLHRVAEDELAERLRAEDSVRRHEREQSLILDTVRAMIWFKDASNRILRCNRAAAEWAGMTPEQIEGRTADEIFPAARARAYHAQDLAVIAAERPRIGELEEICLPGGGRRWVQRDTIPYRDGAGAVVGVVVIAVDVTALKRAEDVAEAKERAEREFLANVSHEFRTPVSAIKGFVQTLRRGAWKNEADRDGFLSIIEANADRLDGLVGDLITLSVIEGAAPLKAAAVHLNPVARDCAEKIMPAARRKRVALRVSVPGSLRARMTEKHLAQALLHLLDNAVKFTPPGGAVRIRARGFKKKAKIWVEDSGIGIPRAELPRVFERFFRVAKGAAPRNPGLGLHLVKKIVESYGGKVSVNSRLAGGSSFCLALPLAAPRTRRKQLR